MKKILFILILSIFYNNLFYSATVFRLSAPKIKNYLKQYDLKKKKNTLGISNHSKPYFNMLYFRMSQDNYNPINIFKKQISKFLLSMKTNIFTLTTSIIKNANTDNTPLINDNIEILKEKFKTHPLYELMIDTSPEGVKTRQNAINYLESNKYEIFKNYFSQANALRKLGNAFGSDTLGQNEEEQITVITTFNNLPKNTQKFVTEKILFFINQKHLIMELK